MPWSQHATHGCTLRCANPAHVLVGLLRPHAPEWLAGGSLLLKEPCQGPSHCRLDLVTRLMFLWPLMP
jgi:hypothetical protein